MMKIKIKQGFKGIIKSIDENHPAAQRLLEMGLTPNTHLHVKHTAFMGDPIVIEVRNYQLAVRKKDLESVIFKD